MAQAPMFRINQLSKDLGIKTKELQSILEEAGIGEKTPMTVLTPDEFNLFLDCAPKNHQIKNLDAYLNGKTYVPSAIRDAAVSAREAEEKASAEAAAKARAEAQAKEKAEAEAKAAEAEAKAREEEARLAEELHEAALRKAAAKAKADAEARRNAEKVTAERSAAKAGDDRFNRNRGAGRTPSSDGRTTKAETEKARVDAHNRIADAKAKAAERPQGQGVQAPIQNQSISTPRTVAMNIQNQGMQGARKKKQQPSVETKRTGSVRIVDTRGGGNVDLSKYDEKLDSFVSVSDNETTKQKLKKQNTRDMRSAKTRDKERLAMEKIKKANAEKAKKAPLKVSIPDVISVTELASRL